MPSTRRRTLLAVVVGTGLGGCLNATRGGSSPTPTRTPTPTPDPECPETLDRPAPETASGEVEPTPYPEPPTALTVESVRSYAVAFERAYRRNAVVASNANLTDVGVDTPERVDAERTDAGVRVGIRYTYYYFTGDEVADSPAIDVAYLVTDRLVYRVESESYETPEGGMDPKSGAIVACLGG